MKHSNSRNNATTALSERDEVRWLPFLRLLYASLALSGGARRAAAAHLYAVGHRTRLGMMVAG